MSINLKDLMDKIDWINIKVNRIAPSTKLPKDKISVEFCGIKKDAPINIVKIRIGNEILLDLGWKPGDKVLPLYNPDDQMTFLLVKSDQGKGFTLSGETKFSDTICRVQFKWNRDIPLERMRPTQVDFAAHRHKLIFRVGPTTEFSS